MEKFLLLFTFGCLSFCFSYGDQPGNKFNKCGISQHIEYLKSKDPAYEQKLKDSEANFRIVGYRDDLKTSNVISTIPVVVHVVYRTASQNISDAQIQSQIDVLNEDFAKLNADTGNVPVAFRSLASGTNFRFCLARRNPEGLATNGIERRQTTITSFSTNDDVKYYSQGGLDAWDVNSYFNIWVCNLGGGILGYAEPPGPHATSYGVVITYDSFGRIGTAAPPYDQGRTSTHEVGHCFGLTHIWGDDGSSCSGSDNIGDTPNQSEETYGCHNFPFVDACSPTSPGIMYMNYMDYSDDDCLNMFTAGQASRMSSQVNLYYPTLLTSTACSESIGIAEAPSDFQFSIYPNPASGFLNVDMFTTRDLGQNVRIIITDALGKTVQTEKINTSSGYVHQFDISSQLSGIYFVTVESDNFKRTQRVTVTR